MIDTQEKFPCTETCISEPLSSYNYEAHINPSIRLIWGAEPNHIILC